MEVLVPNRPPEVNSTEIKSSEASSGVALVNYGQWLDALRLYEVSEGTIGDGDMVTVSVGGSFRHFMFNQETMSWAPIASDSASDASPLVPTMASLLLPHPPCPLGRQEGQGGDCISYVAGERSRSEPHLPFRLWHQS